MVWYEVVWGSMGWYGVVWWYAVVWGGQGKWGGVVWVGAGWCGMVWGGVLVLPPVTSHSLTLPERVDVER